MIRFKIAAAMLCLCVMAVCVSAGTLADDWNKKTVVTFSQPVEIPGGIVLPAGTYVFKLMDSLSDRHIVQVFNEDQSRIYATILAIPNWRLQTTDKTVMTFGESVVGVPQAIRSWFYPGANSGEEFVYPKKRAMELAKANNLPILAMPADMEPMLTQPAKSMNDQPVVALKATPLSAVNPAGEDVEVAQVVTAPPPSQATPTPGMSPTPMEPGAPMNRQARATELPQTATSLPLIGLLGLLSIGMGLALWAVPKYQAR